MPWLRFSRLLTLVHSESSWITANTGFSWLSSLHSNGSLRMEHYATYWEQCEYVDLYYLLTVKIILSNSKKEKFVITIRIYLNVAHPTCVSYWLDRKASNIFLLFLVVHPVRTVRVTQSSLWRGCTWIMFRWFFQFKFEFSLHFYRLRTLSPAVQGTWMSCLGMKI